jgi:hypothetical protein
MSTDLLILPSNKEARETVVSNIVAEGKRARNIKSVAWWMAYHYLQGARRFSSLNFEDGSVEVDYVEDSSRNNLLRYRYEGVVSKLQSQQGRLMNINLAPAVSSLGVGLDGVKKASIAQVILSSIFPEEKVIEMQKDATNNFLRFGTIGLGAWVKDTKTFGIEIIPPWELLPIPAQITRSSECQGLIRRRKVALDWIKTLSKVPGPGAKVWDEVEKTRVSRGVSGKDGDRTGDVLNLSQSVTSSFNNQGKSSDKAQQELMDLVEFTEVWTYTADGFVAEYAMYAGTKEIHYKKYTDLDKMYRPIHMARYMDIGGFWGRSYVDTLIPMNVEVEFMSSRLFQNIEDLDNLGILCEPTNLGIPAEIQDSADGIRRIRYEPDYSFPDLKPFAIQPVQSGLYPMRMLELAKGMLDELANQPTALMAGEAPGRVDSSAGLGMLMETSNTPLSPAAADLAGAAIGCYKYILDTIRKTWSTTDTLIVTQLDDAIAGISFDPTTGEITIPENAIPSPQEVKMSVVSQTPRSPQEQKMALQEALKTQIITPTEYRIQVRKKGLDLPVGNEIEWQNYRRAVYENIQLFKDGETPGTVIVTSQDLHMLHLDVLKAFMASPEFLSASVPVREAFNKHFQMHEAGLGKYPEDMGYPEDIADQQVQYQKMGGEMPPQGMPPQRSFPQEMPPQGLEQAMQGAQGIPGSEFEGMMD